MNTILKTLLFGCLLLACTAWAYLMGRQSVWILEFKIYDADLNRIQHFETNTPPELKEFVKGRYYYLTNKIPKSWLGTPYDYGAVRTNMDLAVGKGDTGPAYEYRIFNRIFKEHSSAFKDPQTGQLIGNTSQR